ncbi:flagellin [Frigidibacter sp. MR17.14]|uniref:flagellin n=1 Tax=Frigidibacter sp. MR17.14 TaxID=3126509 RepID=UPI0030130F4C
MSFASIGDLAKALQFRTNNAQLRQRLAQSSTEMSTGRSHDISARLGGNLTLLAGIERNERRSQVYLRASDVAAAEGDALQSSLGVLSDFTTALGTDLAGTAELAMPSAVKTQSIVARQGLDTAIAALNVRVGEGYLLSGQRSDQKPLPGADAMLSALRAATSGLTTAGDVAAAVDDWFAAPAGDGGFVDFYQGDAGPVTTHRLSENESVSFGMTATNDAFRSVLAGLAIASLAGDDSLEPTVQAADMLHQASTRLIGTTDSIAALRSQLGRSEQTIEDVATRTRANTTAMSLAREKLIGVDTADAATEVVAVQGQLEALYTLTARVTQMKLVNYL